MGRWKSGIWIGLCYLLVLLSGCGAERMVEADSDCRKDCHQHMEPCFGKYGEPVCGIADFWVHNHEDSCYYGNGNLRCKLPQILPHRHGLSCYTWQEQQIHGVLTRKRVLFCPETEMLLHRHTDACFCRGEWSCGQLQILQHIHSEDCFPDPGIWKNSRKTAPFLLLGIFCDILAGCLLYLNKLHSEKTEKSLPYP